MNEPPDTQPQRPVALDAPQTPRGPEREEEIARPEGAPVPIVESDPEGRPTV